MPSRVTAKANNDLWIIVPPLFAMPTLTQRVEGQAPPLLTGDILLVTFEPGGGGVVENQIHIELEQIGAVPEDFFFDHIAMFGQKIHGPIKLVEPKILTFRQPDPIEPALMAGKLGARPIQPLRSHGKKRGFMRRLQLLLTQHAFRSLHRCRACPTSPWRHERPQGRRRVR